MKNNYHLALQRNCSVKHLYLSCLSVIRVARNSQMTRCCYQQIYNHVFGEEL